MTHRTCIRTTSVQLRPAGYRGHDPRVARDLDFTARAIGDKAAVMRRFLIACRGEPYCDGDKVVTEQQVLAEQRVFARDGNPVVLRALMRRFYDLCMTTDHNVVISYASPMYKTDSQIGLATRANRKTGAINPVDPGKLVCRELMEAGIFPLVADDLPDRGFYRSAWIQVFTSVRSWHEANTAYQAETAAMQQRLRKLQDDHPYLNDTAAGLAILAFDAGGRKINRSLAKRWPKIRRSLLSGSGLRGGEAEFFEPYRDLWEDNDRLGPLIATAALSHDLDERKVTARMPKFRDDDTILLSVSGTNTVPVTLFSEVAEHGATAVAGRVLLIDSEHPSQAREVPFGCLPSLALRELELTTVPQGKTRVAVARYRRGNQDRIADIKEPRFRRVGLRGSNGRRLDRQWYLDVIQNVYVAPATPACADPKALWEQLSYFVDSRTRTTPGEVRPGLRVLSVDLGIHPAIAYAAYELTAVERPGSPDSFAVPGIGFAGPIDVGVVGGSEDQELHEAVMEYLDRAEALKGLIRFRSQVMDGAELHSKAIDAATGRFASLGWEFESDPDKLKALLFPQIGVMRHRMDKWINHKRRREVELSIAEGPRDTLCRESFDAINLVMAYIRLNTSWQQNRPPLSTAVLPNRFQAGLWRRVNMMKKDTLCRIGGHIRRLALAHQIDVVLVENLERYRTSVLREKKTNSLLSLWAPATVLYWIKNGLEPHGIQVLQIDPRYSSQIDPRTGAFGFWDFEADKHHLLVQRGAALELINADIAAARNLQRRFWSRGSDLFTTWGVPDRQGAVPLVVDGDGNDPEATEAKGAAKKETAAAIRAARYFEAACGSRYCRITDGRLVSLTKLEYRRALMAAQQEGPKAVQYFRHGDQWLPWKAHGKAVTNLFDRLAIEDHDSEEVMAFVGRVKACWAAKLKKMVGRVL